MRIEVRLFATLRRYVPSDAAGGAVTLDMPQGSKAADVIVKLGINTEEVRILMINGVNGPMDRTLRDGDRLGLFPAVGGG